MSFLNMGNWGRARLLIIAFVLFAALLAVIGARDILVAIGSGNYSGLFGGPSSTPPTCH